MADVDPSDSAFRAVAGAIRQRLKTLEALARRHAERESARPLQVKGGRRSEPTLLSQLLSSETQALAIRNLFQVQPTCGSTTTYEIGSARASDSREYRWEEEVNYDEEWGPNYVGGTWYTFPQGTAVSSAQGMRFSAYAFSSTTPWPALDYSNRIGYAGVLLFPIPPPPCDAIVEWSATPVIDLMFGAEVWGDKASVDLSFVVAQQPESDRFPTDFRSAFDPDIPSGIWYTDESGSDSGRRTEAKTLSGSFTVRRGVASSVLIGVSIYALAEDGQACVGDCTNNTNKDGWFQFANTYTYQFCESPGEVQGLCALVIEYPRIVYTIRAQ